jgi:hypothetical protein
MAHKGVVNQQRRRDLTESGEEEGFGRMIVKPEKGGDSFYASRQRCEWR